MSNILSHAPAPTPGRSTSLIPGVIYEWTPEGSLVVDLDLGSTRAAAFSSIRLASGVEILKGYRLHKRIGVGCTGEVWQAVGPGGVPVALKFVGSGERGSAQEIRSLAWMSAVRHPNLISIFSVWERAEWTAIGMELADESLLDRFETARASSGVTGLEASEVIDFLRQAARGIDFLNEPRRIQLDDPPFALVHRDIKPANLLLVGGGIQVGDFGLVQPVYPDAVSIPTGSTTAIESLITAYSAPEVRRGEVSIRSDQYSLAATYCHLRGGRVPITPVEPSAVPDLSMLPQGERPAVARALAADPAERWPSCAAFVEALATSVPSTDLASTSNAHGLRPIPASARRSVLAAAMLMVALILPVGSWLIRSSTAIDSAPIANQGVVIADPVPAADLVPVIDTGSLVETRSVVVDSSADLPAINENPVPVRALTTLNTDPIDLDDHVDEPTIATETSMSGSEIMAVVHDWGRSTVATLAERISRISQTGQARIARLPHPVQPTSEPTEPRPATLIVQMPTSQAELVVQGEVGRGSPDEWYGPRRVIHTLPISSSRDYVIGAFWTNSSSQIHHRSGTLRVQPGRRYEIDLRAEQPTAVELKSSSN